MESGENPELSRSGIQIRIPIQPIVRKKGEGGEEAKLGARILVLPSLVTCQPACPGKRDFRVLRERGSTGEGRAFPRRALSS
jgi:hypothetical protein